MSQPNNSVFTIQGDGAIQDGCADKRPNDPSIDISIIQFNDDGSFAKPGQLQAALSCITHARRENPNGALVVLLIHGWHHSASWNTRTNKGDSNFAEFRRVLMALALREAERYAPDPAGRRVVGVYIGWNGDPTKGMLSHMNEILSFWNRYKVATRIAQSSNIRQALGGVIDQTKETLDSKVTAQSPLVMIGHSMGAMILETAFLRWLQQSASDVSGIVPGSLVSCAGVASGGRPAVFPDLVLLLNSAAESNLSVDIAAQIKQKQIRKLVSCGPSPFHAPLIISATSKGDTPTRVWFPAARGGRKTAANSEEMLTHKLVPEPTGAVCTPKAPSHIMVDFYQSWHCLRQPTIANDILSNVIIDLPQTRDSRNICHVRYRLESLPGRGSDSPHWIFQVPESLIKDHNDIFDKDNRQSNLFIMALAQLSGSVMSLARDWPDTFENEEGSCALL